MRLAARTASRLARSNELDSRASPATSGPVDYERYWPASEAVTRAEPAELSTNPLAAPNAAQPTDSAHDNVRRLPGSGHWPGSWTQPERHSQPLSDSH